MHQSAIALTILCLLVTVPLAQAETPLPLEQQVDAVADRLEGVMDTATQASGNPKAPNVRMTTCRVTLTDQGTVSQGQTIVLYQEQALATALTKPYRQRFLQLSASPMSPECAIALLQTD
jgi:outer membrane lipoprotein-sorting protein